MGIRDELVLQKERVEAFLQTLWQDEDIPQGLKEAMTYSLLAGGKRLRPILCLKAYELFQERTEEMVPFACGLELIHTYSLIHDDLPMMDDDEYRRGLLTNHKVFGEANALLAGDALLTYGIELMSSHPMSIAPAARLAALQVVLQAAGPVGMVGGQFLDLKAEGETIEAENLQSIHHRKTGALITASLVSGGLLAQGETEQIQALRQYGKELGLLFQITDDLLDVLGDGERLGKETQKDAEKNKATYPKLYGLEGSKKLAKGCLEEGQKALVALRGDTGFFQELLQEMFNRDH